MASNRINRYRSLYEKLVRPNNGSTFPRHVFIRSANLQSSVYERVGDRQNCFESTLLHLTERFNGKEVYLVGSMNQSSMLAQRTKRLIEEIQPDVVLVQTNAKQAYYFVQNHQFRWWEKAKLLQYVDSQEELNKYETHLNKSLSQMWLEPYWSSRKILFLARQYLNGFLFQAHFRFGSDFKFWLPGLEVKYACEAAEKVGAEVHFMGSEINPVTYERLYHETRFNAIQYFVKRFQYVLSNWGLENESNQQKIHLVGPRTFTEKCLDSHLINWYIQATDIFFPRMKQIFVDSRDEDLFSHIDNCEGKKVVAVVNQWHLEGIEHHWCHRYGQVPRAVVFPEGINPVGDMNLREGLFQRLYNYVHREIASANSKGSPATYADWIIGYHRESNWQYEHRDM